MAEITTPRLHLRRPTLDDLDAHYAMVGSDPQVTWNHQAQSREQAQAALEGRIRHWSEHGFGTKTSKRAFGSLRHKPNERSISQREYPE